MTVGGALEPQLAAARQQRRDPWLAVATEVVASSVAMGTTVLVFLNHVGAHMSFYDAPTRIDPHHVQNFWLLVAVLSVAVVASYGAALWRGARWALLWHTLVTVLGVAVAVAFSVTTAGPAPDPEPSAQPERVERPGNPVCYSGGDSEECVGG